MASSGHAGSSISKVEPSGSSSTTTISALFQREFRDSPLIDEIVDGLKVGQENLDVLVWAIDSGLAMDEVLEVLEALDINSRRIEFLLDSRLAHAG